MTAPAPASKMLTMLHSKAVKVHAPRHVIALLPIMAEVMADQPLRWPLHKAKMFHVEHS